MVHSKSRKAKSWMNKEVNPRCQKEIAEENHARNDAGSQYSIGKIQVSVERITSKMDPVENRVTWLEAEVRN